MENIFSEAAYNEMIEKLFLRFPSFQKVGAGAYKPGIANMEFADQLMGHPHRKYKIIHVAGTNGKGSTSNMLTSVLAASGLKVGLYTSPHILDFRERMRVVFPTGESVSSRIQSPSEINVRHHSPQSENRWEHRQQSVGWFRRSMFGILFINGRIHSTIWICHFSRSLPCWR